jgi:phosphotransferase system  glucose/maltose/N-acetylglucosamine-specific IIC component
MLGSILIGIVIAAILIFTFYGLFPKYDEFTYRDNNDENQE